MESQKWINLLYNTPNQPSKFWTKNWVKKNDNVRGRYNRNSQIKLNFNVKIKFMQWCDDSDV